MKSELERLSSFKSWNFQPSNKLTPPRLARLGFYWEGGNIRCMNCTFAVLVIDTEDMNAFVHRHQDASSACSTEIENVLVNSPLLSPCELVKSFEANSTESDSLAIDCTDHHVPTVPQNLDVHNTKELNEILKNSYHRARHRGLFGNDNATFRKDIDRKNPDYIALQNEMTRLWTFFDWPADVPAKPDVLAKAGFFYAGDIDIVRCAFCKGCLRNWEPEDVPIEEHRKHFPDCSFVKNTENTNNLGKLQVPRPLETCSVNVTAQQQSTAAPSLGHDSWNHSSQPPRHPHMADETRRIESFTGKIVPRGQNVKILANAGFFNVGPQDNVKCFHCDGGLKNWQSSDDPWHEHARWFPQCKYLQSRRNPDFIRVIQEKYQQTLTVTLQLLQRNLAQGLSSTNVGIGSNNQWVANNESAVLTYHVEPREVKARMDTATVRAVIAMGYSRQLVRQVIQKQLVETGDDFSSAESLVEAIIEEQDRSDQAAAAIAQQLFSQSIGVPLINASEYLSPAKHAPASFQTHGSSSTSVYVTTGAPASAMGNNGEQSRSQLDKSTESPQNSSTKAKKRNKKKKNRPEQTSATAPEDISRCVNKKDKKANTEESLEQKVENEDEMATLGGRFLASDPQVLLEENRKLIEAKICNICMDAERNIVFLPCGHLVCCSTCAPELRTCPICRSMIRGTVRTFLS